MRETTDDDQILKDAARILSKRLQFKVAALAQMQSAIECLNRESDKTTHLDSQPGELKSDPNFRIRRDLFFGLRLSTAVQKCLQMRGEAMDADEILGLLRAGGFATDSLGSVEDVQLANLAAALRKNTKTFHRLPNGAFGLVAWYSDVLDSRQQPKHNRTKRSKSTEEPVDLVSAGDGVTK